MAFFNLCNDDQIVNTLHSVFNANIVRIPETRFQPLSVIAVANSHPYFWGDLNDLIEGAIPDVQSAIKESRMADISGKRSKTVNAGLGLQILQGFLGGFSLPSAAIATKFTGAKTVSFTFQEVMRAYISSSQIGTLLQGHALDKEHASNTIFFDTKAKMLIIDSIITSKNFSINVESASAKDFILDVPAIETMVGQAQLGIKVASNTGLDIVFKGDTPLTFAFTCLCCQLDEAGRISLAPSYKATHFDPNQSVDHELLYDEPSMIEWGK